MVQFQFSEKLFTHVTFSKFITSTELLLTTICLHLSLPLQRYKSHSSQKHSGKDSKCCFAKAKQLARKQDLLAKLVILLDLNRSESQLQPSTNSH